MLILLQSEFDMTILLIINDKAIVLEQVNTISSRASDTNVYFHREGEEPIIYRKSDIKRLVIDRM